MSHRVTGVFLVLLVLFAVPALAVDPAVGTYTSVGIGFGSENVLVGRDSNSRPAAGGGIDNVFNSQSWDGVVLGTQWVFKCGKSTSQTVDNNLDGNGNGEIVVTTEYTGGTFWLSKNGPWGDGFTDLSGALGGLTRVTSTVYVLNVAQAGVENVTTSGTFNESDCVLAFEIHNNVVRGDTDTDGPIPGDYPSFFDLACAATRSDGWWNDVKDIIMLIQCPVPAHETTWGQVKSLFE